MSYISNDPKDAMKKVQVMTQATLDEEAKLLSNVKLQVLNNAKLLGAPMNSGKTKNIIPAFMAGLVFSIGLAIFLELLNNTIKDEEDVAKYLEIPVVGVMPKY